MSDFNIEVLAVGGAFAVPLVGILAGIIISWIVNWRKVRVSEHLAALKQTMIERGMSGEEIERVINAGLAAGNRVDPCAEAPSERGHRY